MGHPMVPKITIAVRSKRCARPSTRFPAVQCGGWRRAGSGSRRASASARGPFAGYLFYTPEFAPAPARDVAPPRERFGYAGLLPGHAAWSLSAPPLESCRNSPSPTNLIGKAASSTRGAIRPLASAGARETEARRGGQETAVAGDEIPGAVGMGEDLVGHGGGFVAKGAWHSGNWEIDDVEDKGGHRVRDGGYGLVGDGEGCAVRRQRAWRCGSGVLDLALLAQS